MPDKIIPFSIALKATRKTFAPVPVIYTNDQGNAFLQFTITDMTSGDLTGATGEVLFYAKDGSFFVAEPPDVALAGTVFSYTLSEAAGNHAGRAKVQLVVTIGAKKFASQLYSLDVIAGLDTEVANEQMIQDWTILVSELQGALDQTAANLSDLEGALDLASANLTEFDVALETGVIAANLAAWLAAWEIENSSRLAALEATGAARIIDMSLFVKGGGEPDDSLRMQRAIDYCAANDVPLVLDGGLFTLFGLDIPAGVRIYGNGAVWKKPELDAAPYNYTVAQMNSLGRMAEIYWDSTLDSDQTFIDGITWDGNCYTMWPGEPNFDMEQASMFFVGANPAKAGRLHIKMSNCHFRDNVSDGIHVWTNCIFEAVNCTSIDCFRGGLTMTGGYTDAVITNWVCKQTTAAMRDGIDIEIDSPGYGGTNVVNIALNNIVLDDDFDVACPSNSTIVCNNIIQKGGSWYFYSKGNLTIMNSQLKKQVTDSWNCIISGSGQITFENCDLDGGNTTDGVAMPLQTFQPAAARDGVFAFKGCRFVNCRYGIGSALLEAVVIVDDCDFNELCDTAIGYSTGNPAFQPYELHVRNNRFRNFGYAVKCMAVATYMPLTTIYLSGNERLNPSNLGLNFQNPIVHFRDDEFLRWPITLGGAAIPLYYKQYAGTTANRPKDPAVGQRFFDTTLGKQIFCTALGIKEELTLTITGPCTTSGDVTITMDGGSNTVAVTAGMTAIQVADLCRAKRFTKYSNSGTVGTDVAVYTKRYQGTSGAYSFAPGTTGVTATFVQVAGTANTWDEGGASSAGVIGMDLFIKGVGEPDDTLRMQRAVDYCAANDVPLVLDGGTFTLYDLDIPPGVHIYGNGAKWTKPELDVAPYSLTDAQINFARLASVPWSNAADSEETVIDGIVFDGNCWAMWATPSSIYEQSALLFLGSGQSLAGRLRVKVSNCRFQHNAGGGIQTYANVVYQIENCTSVDCYRGGLFVSGGNSSGTVDDWISTSTRSDMRDGVEITISNTGYGGSYVTNTTLSNIILDDDFNITVPGGSVVTASNIIQKGGSWYLKSSGRLLVQNSILRKDITDTSDAIISGSGQITFENCDLDGGNTTDGIAMPLQTISASARDGVFAFKGCRFINCRYGIGSALLDAVVVVDDCDFNSLCETAVGHSTGNPAFQPYELHVRNNRFRNFGYAVKCAAVATFMPLTTIYLSGNERLNPSNLGLYFQNPIVHFRDDETLRWPIVLGGAAIPLYYKQYAGTTANRPKDPVVGQQFFDTTLAKPIFCTTLGDKEVLTLTVTAPATASGDVTITMDGGAATVAVTAGMTAIQVADACRAKLFTKYVGGGTVGTNVATFTKRYQGTSGAYSFSGGTTGVTATFTQAAGTANTWKDAAGTTV